MLTVLVCLLASAFGGGVVILYYIISEGHVAARGVRAEAQDDGWSAPLTAESGGGR